jgi:hypothetical protein
MQLPDFVWRCVKLPARAIHRFQPWRVFHYHVGVGARGFLRRAIGHGPNLANLACRWVPLAVAAGLGVGAPVAFIPWAGFAGPPGASVLPPGSREIASGAAGAVKGWAPQTEGLNSGGEGLGPLPTSFPAPLLSDFSPSLDSPFVAPTFVGKPTTVASPVSQGPITPITTSPPSVSEPASVLLLSMAVLTLLLLKGTAARLGRRGPLRGKISLVNANRTSPFARQAGSPDYCSRKDYLIIIGRHQAGRDGNRDGNRPHSA